MAQNQTQRVISTFISLCSDMGTKFVRKRIWSPRSVFVALLLLTGERGQNYRRMLGTFVTQTAGFLGWSKTPALSSLSQARRSLSVDTCRAFLAQLIERISQCVPNRLLHPTRRRFIAFDGTRVILPRTEKTMALYERPKYTSWIRSHYPQALVVFAMDVFKRVPLDWTFVPRKKGERDGVLRMFHLFKPGDVAVFDRGYPARWFLNELLSKGVDFMMRMTVADVGAFTEVMEFIESGRTDAVVDVRLDDGRTVPLRMVLRNPRQGRSKNRKKVKPTVVLTSLSSAEFNRDEIMRLYDSRWGIETMMREVKCEFDVERFHARSLQGVEQEIAAVLTWIAVGSSLQHIAESQLPDGRRVLRSLCFSSAHHIIEAWLNGEDPMQALDAEIEYIKRYHYLPKKGRSFTRHRKGPYGRFRNSDATK